MKLRELLSRAGNALPITYKVVRGGRGIRRREWLVARAFGRNLWFQTVEDLVVA